ncbi:hypothetical protein Pmar_PMAR027981 [Perkinsus marinus ATCC 50983]|uniref:Uncharacterized protein n=1 Tax=Perkinsus marinus (strain ATCC 50983 / TXsc) TaxID=423536 RepID=C5LV81_PERM5|nr:hypothetical protein Pmar_PMAR027981 [Perkinsus marinus ATCC 50983]EEQ99319.1 hypothetical protein Pmar_PMAR027981 [Perkinsus marinus ATCC 50983]|eukprot:XP_002766602.1 hypothetical protein Pmar_PMAR027981 [Perkinsus marinus ATCC 50983]
MQVISDDGSIMPSIQLDAVTARGRVEQLPGHTEELEQRLYAEKDHTIQQLKMQLAHELEEASTSRRELAEARETLGRERAEMEYKVQQLEEQVAHAVEEVNSVKKEFSEARKAWTQEQESSAFALADLKIEAQQ